MRALQAEVATSRADNAELCIANEELRRGLQHVREQVADEHAPPVPLRARPMLFSRAIMNVVLPTTSLGPKVSFTGVEDPEAHLTAFHTQMMLTRGSDAIYCKMLMSTLSGTALEWFISLPDGHITSFDQFATLFREHYLVNKAPTRLSYDVFYVKQYQGESMKDYLNRFAIQVVCLKPTDEAMIVLAFVKGMLPGPFSESLLRVYPRTFAEIRRRALAHITADDRVTQKQGLVDPVRPRATTRHPPMRVHKATAEKKGAEKPYEQTPSKARPRQDPPPKHNFRVELKELIGIPNIVARLNVPAKTDRKMGPNKNAWCEFHQANGHHIRNCLALAHQLDELVKSGFLKDYLQEEMNDQTLVATGAYQGHEVPIHGEVNAISGGFPREEYASQETTEARQTDLAPDVDLTFTQADLQGVVPYDNDPVAISLIAAKRRVRHVLVDQGSSVNVMFLTTFNRLQLSADQLKPYARRLYGFAGNEVKVHGYFELSTTFTDNLSSHTTKVRYLVVDAPLAYNILLGRSSLNKLKAVPSTRHIASDLGEAKRSYENSLKTREGIFSVTSGPPREDGVTREEIVRENRPEPAGGVVEREIGGRCLNLGNLSAKSYETKSLKS